MAKALPKMSMRRRKAAIGRVQSPMDHYMLGRTVQLPMMAKPTIGERDALDKASMREGPRPEARPRLRDVRRRHPKLDDEEEIEE